MPAIQSKSKKWHWKLCFTVLSTGRIVINYKYLQELLESRVPGLEKFHDIT